MTTEGCHLCEVAEELLSQILSPLVSIECIDIAESEQLVDTYGLHIPVLRNMQTGEELGWPFDALQAQQFLYGVMQ